MRVLITGAARGIGAETAALLRAGGAHVTALDLQDPGAGADDWIAVDLAEDGAAARALTRTEGRFDAAVLSAGIPPRPGNASAVLAVNWMGFAATAEALLPRMAPGGALVGLASKAGARWRQNLAQLRRLMALTGTGALPGFVAAEAIDPVRAYDLSKEAVIAWTRAGTRRLQALGLRANCVSPAAVDTAILPDFEAAFGDRAARGTALMGRAGTAREVAEVVAFLAGPASGWIKGVDLPVDGGLAAMLEAEALDLPGKGGA